MEQNLVDDMSQDSTNNLCDEERGNRNVHGRFVDPDGTDNMETIIIPFNRLEVNIIHSRHGHGEGKSVLNGLFLGLDIEILEPNPIDREKDLFSVMEQNIHFALLVVIIVIILENPIRAHLGFMVYHRTTHEPITHRQLIVRIDMDHHTVVWKVRNG